MTEAEFRTKWATLGLVLDARAFAAAWAGAQHLRGEVTRVKAWLDEQK